MDLDRDWTVKAADNLSHSDFSVYEGRTMRGAVMDVGVRGSLVVRDGNLVGEPGTGRYLRRFPRLEAVSKVA